MGTGLYEEVSCNSESSVKKQLNDEAVLDGIMGKVCIVVGSSRSGVLKERRKLDAYLIRSIIIFLFFFVL